MKKLIGIFSIFILVSVLVFALINKENLVIQYQKTDFYRSKFCDLRLSGLEEVNRILAKSVFSYAPAPESIFAFKKVSYLSDVYFVATKVDEKIVIHYRNSYAGGEIRVRHISVNEFPSYFELLEGAFSLDGAYAGDPIDHGVCKAVLAKKSSELQTTKFVNISEVSNGSKEEMYLWSVYQMIEHFFPEKDEKEVLYDISDFPRIPDESDEQHGLQSVERKGKDIFFELKEIYPTK